MEWSKVISIIPFVIAITFVIYDGVMSGKKINHFPLITTTDRNTRDNYRPPRYNTNFKIPFRINRPTLFNGHSCPPLEAEFGVSRTIIITRGELTCKSGYEAFPYRLGCFQGDESSLQWSHLPVCLPVQTQIDHFKNVYCEGNSTMTTCQIICESNYIPSQHQPYVCHSSPCPAWRLHEIRNETEVPKCIPCDEKCRELNVKEALKTCPCKNVLLKMKGNYSSSYKFTPIFGFYSLEGLFNGRPQYGNNLNDLKLFYSNILGWNLRSMQLNSNVEIYFDASSEIFCPNELNGNDAKKRIRQRSYGIGSEISIECFDEKPNSTFSCPCKVYGFDYLQENATSKDPYQMKYILNNYTLNAASEIAPWVTSPIYDNKETSLISTDGYFRGWHLQSKNNGTLAIGYVLGNGSPVCPDDERLTWKYKYFFRLNSYISDNNLKVKCMEK